MDTVAAAPVDGDDIIFLVNAVFDDLGNNVGIARLAYRLNDLYLDGVVKIFRPLKLTAKTCIFISQCPVRLCKIKVAGQITVMPVKIGYDPIGRIDAAGALKSIVADYQQKSQGKIEHEQEERIVF